jgi:hypothetical protein
MATTEQPANDDATAREREAIAEQKRAALDLLGDAFSAGLAEGLDADCLAQAALFFALKEFVTTYGEEPVARFTEKLPQRVLNGEFTLRVAH